MVNFTSPSINFTYWQQHMIEWFIAGYVNVVGGFFWAILFTGVIAYVYVKNASVIAASVAILILFGAFAGTGIFAGTPMVVMFYQLVVALSISGLVVIFLMRRRQ